MIMEGRKVIIMGAAGRDFHDFNAYFKDNEAYEVVAFTATQIPDIEKRWYPAELSGSLYPRGIPIHSEGKLLELIKEHGVHEVIFSYSDISHERLMNKASAVLAAGSSFRLLSPKNTFLRSRLPVVAICAVRTGCGKSQTTRYVVDLLKAKDLVVAVVRHPMPYGDLIKQRIQKFATLDDLDRYECTIEEREEYEPHIERGSVVYAGVDYGEILEQAELDSEVIVWDGGNNDLPFFKPNVHIVVADPLRAGHELKYHPGETNLRMANCVIINKIDSSTRYHIDLVKRNVEKVNPGCLVLEASSPLIVDDPKMIQGKRVLVIEDGPTLTHGEMKIGAGYLAASKCGASEIVCPKPYAVNSLADTYKKYSHLGNILPAMGYGDEQIADLEDTINQVPCDVVVVGTPIDLRRIITINKPAVRVTYEIELSEKETFEALFDRF